MDYLKVSIQGHYLENGEGVCEVWFYDKYDRLAKKGTYLLKDALEMENKAKLIQDLISDIEDIADGKEMEYQG